MKPGPKRLAQSLRTLPHTAGTAFLRTPLEVLLGFIAWLGLAISIERSTVETAWPQLAVATGIALPLVYATSVLYATATITRWSRWLIAGLVVTIAALYAFYRFDPDLAAEGWRAAMLIAMAVLALLATPLIVRAPSTAAPEPPPTEPDVENGEAQIRIARQSRPDRRARTHLFTSRLATRTIIVGIYALALYAGLAAALAAVDGLFALDLPDNLYGHLAALVFILMPPWAIVAGLPDLIAPAVPWSAGILRALRRIGLFLLAPLIAVYLLIVYAYTIRMAITGEVPSNLVSPVVLGAGVLTLAATFLLEPLHSDDDARGLTRFLRLLPALLLPLTALALWAVLLRVDQHGWTEFRYLRVLAVLFLAGFALAGAWRLRRGERPPLTALPASAAVVLLIAAVGPLSAPAVSYRSQTARLEALIPAASERSTASPTPLAPETLADATNRAYYIRDHFGWNALEPILPPDATKPADRSYESLAATLGLTEAVDHSLPRLIHAALPAATGVPGTQGGTLYLVDYERLGTPHPPVPTRPHRAPRPATAAPTTATGQLRATTDTIGTTITIHPPAGGPTLTANLTELTRQLIAATDTATTTPIHEYDATLRRVKLTARSIETTLPPTTALIPLVDAAGQPRGQLLLRNITIRATPEATTIEGWTGVVLLRS